MTMTKLLKYALWNILVLATLIEGTSTSFKMLNAPSDLSVLGGVTLFMVTIVFCFFLFLRPMKWARS